MATHEPVIPVTEFSEDCLKDDPLQRRESPKYNWEDNTKEFFDCCDELKLGELLHDNDFGLFEAMSAIEMMDPKMDAGMSPQHTPKVMNLEESIESEKIKIIGFIPSEIIGIVDATMSCLVTWLEGNSLAQTVFTNLYLHNPYIIEDPTLKAFSICILKTVDLIRDRINRASVFEEEDFQSMTYGFKFTSDVTDLRTTGMMKEVEDELNKVIRSTRPKQGNESRVTNIEKEHELAVAVYSRIKCCRLFFITLLAFSKEKCQGILEAQKYLRNMCELLPAISRTTDLAVNASENANEDYPTIMGFEPLVNQRLLPPTFPRYTKIKNVQQTMNYLHQLVAELQHVCTIMEHSSVHTSMDFFSEFTQTLPSVLSRSLLQLTYLSSSRKVFGKEAFTDALRDTIRNFISPPVLMAKGSLLNNSQAKDYTDTFLYHAVRPMCSVFQIFGHNRARQRDKWANILEELSALQDEADKVDAVLHSLLIKNEPTRQHLACFGTWALYHLLKAMISFALSGFELELYAIHEYHYVFWYLYECLYNWLVSAITRADSILLDQETYLEQQKSGKTAKKNKKKRKTRPHGKEITLTQACQNLCGGYFKAMLAFKHDGKIPKLEFEFDCEEVRYNHRFAPFGNVTTPPPVLYAYFREATDFSQLAVQPKTEDMFVAACKCFHQAKVLLETISNPSEEIENLLKIAKTNFIVMKLLAGGHKKDSKNSPEFDFSLHKTFPMIKI